MRTASLFAVIEYGLRCALMAALCSANIAAGEEFDSLPEPFRCPDGILESPDPAAAEIVPPAEPWTVTDLFRDRCGGNCLKDHDVQLYGNLVQSFAFNFQGPRDKFNGPVTWTDRSNEYELNQLWLVLEKTTDTSKQDWNWGGMIEANYGTSSRLMTASGFEGNLNGNNAFYGWAFPSAYGEIAYKNLKVKVGRYISPIGYFNVNTTLNFFNTIPYTFEWGEPFTHTGVSASYQVNDRLNVTSAIVRGWDNFDNSNPNFGYLGTWSYTFRDKSNLTHMLIYSREPNANDDFTPRYFQSVVYQKPLNDKWKYVAESDFGVQKDATTTGRTAFWYGFNQYLFYTVNDRLTFGAEFEWWRDEEGYRCAGFLPGDAPSGITSPARGFPINRFGYAGNFYQATFGPKWFPTGSQNCYVRPNFRFDWFQGDVLNPGGLKPYDDGGKNYQAVFITDLVILF